LHTFNLLARYSALVLLLVISFSSNDLAAESNRLLKNYNRSAHNLNLSLDRLLLLPLSKAYQNITTPFVRSRVSTFFQNAGVLNTLVNDLFQSKYKCAYDDSQRILVNYTLGIGGLFDVASNMNIPYHSEDMGQTLAVWGVKPGPYVVLPILGPSNFRDAGARLSDFFINPIQLTQPRSSTSFLTALDKIDSRPKFLAFDDLVVGDHFIFTKEAYKQQREWEISDGKINTLEF
jgi:phospholipid-binding lipoprotein MlaA